MRTLKDIERGLAERCLWWLPDGPYLKLMCRIKMGAKLDLDHPRDYYEKIHWLKINQRDPLLTTLVDKAAVKPWVAEKIGSKYVIPTLGLWEHADEIDYDSLPAQFVLKTTHSGGNTGVVICRDKSKLDKTTTAAMLNASLRDNPYRRHREWPYLNVPPRVIAEKLLVDPENPLEPPRDYKFLCFDGKPRIVKLDVDRWEHHCANYYDTDFNLLPFWGDDYPPDKLKPQSKPHGWDTMLEIARTLSQGLPHVRVDLYDIAGKIYFGELTFFHAGGWSKFVPEEWNKRVGDLIKLPTDTKPS